jgi:hypothetical protein
MKFQWLCLGLALIILTGCGNSPVGQSSEGGSNTAQPQARVLLIGLDGTRSAGIQQANTPNLDALIAEGFVDYDAITNDVSLSGPGWASMLSGVWCDKHGVVDNDLTWANSRFDEYPHVLFYAEQQRPQINSASVSHWAPINSEIACADERGGECVLDHVMSVATDIEVRDEVVRLLRDEDPHFLFMQFDDIDHAGHGDLTDGGTDIGGFCPHPGGDPSGGNQGGVCSALDYNANYISTIELTDGYVGEIMAALKARPNYAEENWLVLSSPDHGGAGTVKNQHGFPTAQERRTFFISSGQAARPFPDAQVKIVDVAATALHHLGITIDPAWGLDGRPVAVVDAPDYVDDATPSCFNPAVFLPDIGTL